MGRLMNPYAYAARWLLLGSLFALTLIAVGRGSRAAVPEAAAQRGVERAGYAADGRIVPPVNQVLTPYGRQIDLPGLRPQAVAISPDGALIVTAGKSSELIVVDAASGAIRQ